MAILMLKEEGEERLLNMNHEEDKKMTTHPLTTLEIPI